MLSKVVATWGGWSWWSLGTPDDRLSTGEFLFGFLLVVGFLRDFLTPPCPPSHPAHRPLGRVRAWALAHPWRFRTIVIAAGAVVVFACELLIGWYTWDSGLISALAWSALMVGLAAWCRPEQPCGATDPTDPSKLTDPT